MELSFLTRFAVTYNCNAYGASTYNNDEPCETTVDNGGTQPNTPTLSDTTQPTTTSQSSSTLAATGTNIAISVVSGLLLIVIGIVLVMRLRKKPASSTK